MKVAVIGSRNAMVNELELYIPVQCSEIVSGGAKGVDLCAREYAKKNNIKLTEFLPEYSIYGKAATIVRNKKIVEYSDLIIAFWDGYSKGTKFTIDYCKKSKKECRIVFVDSD